MKKQLRVGPDKQVLLLLESVNHHVNKLAVYLFFIHFITSKCICTTFRYAGIPVFDYNLDVFRTNRLYSDDSCEQPNCEEERERSLNISPSSYE